MTNGKSVLWGRMYNVYVFEEAGTQCPFHIQPQAGY